jgi:Rieske Fe-S protein
MGAQVTQAIGGFALPPGGPARPASDRSPSDEVPAPSRRSLLVGTGVAVVAAAAGATWYAVAGPTPRKSPSDTGYSEPSATGTNLGPLTGVPENGGTVFDDQEIVVTRGAGSTVHGFSAVCTHQGCLVSRVSEGEITCPCHGSAFDATTGAVVRGPAQRPLPAVPVKVVNGSVVTG